MNHQNKNYSLAPRIDFHTNSTNYLLDLESNKKTIGLDSEPVNVRCTDPIVTLSKGRKRVLFIIYIQGKDNAGSAQ